MEVHDKKIPRRRAIDEDKTKQRHQIIGVSVYGKHDGVVHLATYKPSTKLKLSKELVSNMQDVLLDIRKLRTDAGKLEGQNVFSQLMQQVKYNEHTYFKLNMPADTITFNISYGRNYKIHSIDHEITKAIMTDELSCKQARNNLLSSEPDQDLQIIHDLAVFYKYDEMIKRKLSFEDVNFTITQIVERHMCEYAVKNGLPGIFKVPPILRKGDKFRQKKASDYGSTLKFDYYINKTGADKSRAVLPLMACRKPLDALNQLSLEASLNGCDDLYSNDVLTGLVNYHAVRKPSNNLVFR